MIKLICFDLWETLVTEPSSFEDIWDPFAKKYPKKVDWQKVRDLIAHISQKKNQPTKTSTAEILAEFGVSNQELVAETSKRWEDSCDHVSAFPETIEVLRDLHANGYKLGLITNTSRYGWESVDRACGLGTVFDYLALSFRIGAVKPEPKIFTWVESESGFSGDKIVMIGDSFKSDYEAPRKIGWKSILSERGASRYPQATPTIHSLHEIKEALVDL